MSNIEEDLKNSVYTNLDKSDLKVLVEDIMLNSTLDNPREFVMYTGYGGFMSFNYSLLFKVHGRTPYPRKLKKKIWGERKDRRKYSYEYYKAPKVKKVRGNKYVYLKQEKNNE